MGEISQDQSYFHQKKINVTRNELITQAMWVDTVVGVLSARG
jgi:hypothetical protein